MWSIRLQRSAENICLIILFIHYASAYALVSARGETCRNSIYCHVEDGHEIRTNDCSLERPTREVWKRKSVKLVDGFQEHFDSFMKERALDILQSDEITFPAWYTKRIAPNHPPFEMICDGLSQCSAPSCEDFTTQLPMAEKELAQHVFEFFSTLDHAHHAMDLAVSDFFEALSFDIEWIPKEFTYGDELQDKAIEKKKKQDMIFALITALLLTLSALTGTADLFATPLTAGVSSAVAGATARAATAMMAKVGSTASRVSKFVKVGIKETKLGYRGKEGAQVAEKWGKQVENLNTVAGSIVTGGFIGITGFVKEANNIKHGDDLEGFDKFLALFKHFVAGVTDQAHHEIQENMVTLVKSGKISGGLDLSDLIKSDFYSDADVDLRGFISSTMTKMFTARIIGSLWHNEGVHIVESRVEGNTTCEQDTRGPGVNRVCLPERPRHTYHIQAITHYDDDKVHPPPGLEHLITEHGYKGLTKEDVMRSSLFQYEVWRTRHSNEEPRIEMILQEAAKSPGKRKRDLLDTGLTALGDDLSYTELPYDELVARENTARYTIKQLEHYGEVPAAFNLPICRSWFGQAMSGIEENDELNAPCFCDSSDPSKASKWEQPNNWTMGYTKQFIMDGEFYRMHEYGKLCHKNHDCTEEQKWKQVLGLPADEELPKEMEDAWDRCLDPGEPGGGAHPKRLEPLSSTFDLIPRTVTEEVKVIVQVGTNESVIYTIPSGAPSMTRDWVTHTTYKEFPMTAAGGVVTGTLSVPIVETRLEWVAASYPPQPTISPT